MAANAPALKLINVIPIPPTPQNASGGMYSFDISWFDPVTGLYYLADRSNAALDVIDTTGAFNGGKPDALYGQIGGPVVGFTGFTGSNDTSGPDGVVVGGNCIIAGNGNSTAVSFNTKVSFITPASTVNTGGQFRVDEMAFDVKDGLALVANNAEDVPFATLLSVDANCKLSIVAKITFDNMPGGNVATNGAEQPVWEPITQRFYISIPEVNGNGGTSPTGGIAQITTSGTIEKFYPIGFCQPSGLTVGPNGDLLAQCSTIFDTSGNACSASAPSPAGNSNNVRLAKCTGIASPQVVVCNPGKGCTGNSLVAVKGPGGFAGPGGGDEVWFNAGDGNYYISQANNPKGPSLAVVASSSTKTPNTLVQEIPTIAAQGAVVPSSRGEKKNVSGTVHSVAASSSNNHVYVPLPANTAYGPNCFTGCVAVYSAE